MSEPAIDEFVSRETYDRVVEGLTKRIGELEARESKLLGAVSWIETPFVTDETPEAELRQRLKFVLADVARSLLGQSLQQKESAK